MKTHDYIIELKKPSYRVVDMISRLMLMISIATFVYFISLIRDLNWITVTLGILVLGMIGWWIRSTVRQNKDQVFFYRFGLLIATIGWVIFWKSLGGPVWVAIVFFIAVVFEKQVKFPEEIAFNEGGIIINSFPQRSYEWSALANVVLKDCILTIDFKNNKLIQKETEEDTTGSEEKEFNEFCRNQLNNAANS